MVEVLVVDNYEAVSRAGAEIVVAAMEREPALNLVAATGNTPMGLYRELTDRKRRGVLNTGQMRVFQLDEYAGIGPDDRRSLYLWMKRSLLDPLGIPQVRAVRLRGDAADAADACREYDQAVEDAGGFDLGILGLGPNGHLGFNEPPSGPHAPTRRVTLTPESVRSNAVYWGSEDEVPRVALTAGMRLLLAARQIVLVVSGEGKREIMERVLEGPMVPDIPASFLRLAPNVTVVADRAAAGRAGP